MAEAFDTVWIDGLLYMLTLLNFPYYILHKYHCTYWIGRSKRPSRWTRHLVEACGLGWLRVDSSPFSSSVYVNDMPSPSHHVELALYADDTAIIATSRKPTLFDSLLQSYFNEHQLRLSE